MDLREGSTVYKKFRHYHLKIDKQDDISNHNTAYRQVYLIEAVSTGPSRYRVHAATLRSHFMPGFSKRPPLALPRTFPHNYRVAIVYLSAPIVASDIGQLPHTVHRRVELV